jgi:hypothetical protein
LPERRLAAGERAERGASRASVSITTTLSVRGQRARAVGSDPTRADAAIGHLRRAIEIDPIDA